MRKLGVCIFLTILTFSATYLLFTTINNEVPVLTEENDSINEDAVEAPQMSGNRDNNYFPEDVTYEWEDLEGNIANPLVYNASTLWSGDLDDGYITFPMAFWFDFYDISTKWAYISTNGYISFSDASPTEDDNYDFPLTGGNYYYMIAAFWDDIDFYRGGNFYIGNFSDRFVLEYKDVWHSYGPYIGSFEIVLYDDGRIQFNYEEIQYIWYGYTLGTNKGSGGIGTTYNKLATYETARSIRLQNDFKIFSDDFESGSSKWTGIDGDLWHITDTDNHTGDNSLWCANQTTGFYNETTPVYDTVEITDLDLRDYWNITMTFYLKKQTENSPSFDQLLIAGDINTNHLYLSSRWTDSNHLIFDVDPDYGVWTKITVDLSFFCGFDHVDIQFIFDTRDTTSNEYSGVKIDDVEIIGGKEIQTTDYDSLDIEEDDEFIWYMYDLSTYDYDSYLGTPTAWSHDDKCKIKIYDIDEYEDYWEVTTRFWEFGDNLNNDGESEEIVYIIYKNPVNHRGGCDFFIPDYDVYWYLEDSDNIGKGSWERELNVNREYWGDNEVMVHKFQDIMVEKKYNYDGILQGLTVVKNKDGDGWQSIYSFELERDDDDDHDDDSGSEDDGGMDDRYVSIPGYDLIVFIPLVIGAIALTMRKISKSRRV